MEVNALDAKRLEIGNKYGIDSAILLRLCFGQISTLECPNQEIADALASVYPDSTFIVRSVQPIDSVFW